MEKRAEGKRRRGEEGKFSFSPLPLFSSALSFGRL